ncbi:HupE/UreJ family protein [Sulfurimonas crateris]|uniref:HupE/UreJ family protein n=1 Tax=Sulfurimonas crateris TaxID=2574727 RepID=A0A4U2Z4T6_9BACT|nr:HupE/UreJ family protein [Sulfurimonas crateris]TKI68775.1 HupE/UreJ family protein [Sulfurimonas crateris]
MKIFFILLAFLLLKSAAYAHGMSEADIEAMIEGGNLRYIWLGATHMLSGYDHLLFLFGVVFFLSNTKDIIKFVTIFTLGHSITLILATFMGINANYYLIDAVIALSVIYKAFDNNKGFESYLGIKSPNLMLMVLLFGLIHGFGLSSRLQQLPLGEQSWSMLLEIISFNIGVEIGQIIALIGMLFILKLWREKESFTKYAKVSNHALMFAGFMLLLMQLHGYLHTTNEEEFGFNRDEHIHIHMDMEKQNNYTHDSL